MSEWWHFLLGGLVMIGTFRGLDALSARLRRRRASHPSASMPEPEQTGERSRDDRGV